MSQPNTIQCYINDTEWQNLIKRMVSYSQKESWKVIRNVARDYTRAAAKQTRIAKRLRFKKIQSHNGQAYWIPVRPPRRPSGFGWARLGWFKALDALGVKLANPNKKIRNAAPIGIFSSREDATTTTIIVGNAAPYISRLDVLDGIDTTGQRTAWVILERNVRKYEDNLGAL